MSNKTFDPKAWVSTYAKFSAEDEGEIQDILYFPLICNIFERESFGKRKTREKYSQLLKTIQDKAIIEEDVISNLWNKLIKFLQDDDALARLKKYLLPEDEEKKDSEKAKYVETVIHDFKQREVSNPRKMEIIAFVVDCVRNNFFHGEKLVGDLPKQKLLFGVCSEFMSLIIDAKVNHRL